MDLEKFEKIRKEQFPLTGDCAYLDTATTGLISKNSRDAMVGHIEERFEGAMNIGQVRDSWKFADELRETVARVVNADAEEIFFGSSCSEMLNVFSNGIELGVNANIVTSGLSFPSTPFNWMNRIGEDNVRIVEAEDGQIAAQRLFDKCDENTAAIVLCLVENSSGFRHDIKEIGDFCKDRGIFLVLDAAQCIGAMEIDVKNTHIDFLVASTYKWLSGLFGIAFGYISKRVLDKVSVTNIGWCGNKNRFSHNSLVLNLSETASKFECGNLNWIGLKGIEQSIKIYLELGRSEVHRYILSLTEYLYEKVREIDRLEIIGPFDKKNRSGVIYINFPREWNLNNQVLAQNGIRVNSYESSMRIALHFYNNTDDIDVLCDFLKTCS